MRFEKVEWRWIWIIVAFLGIVGIYIFYQIFREISFKGNFASRAFVGITIVFIIIILIHSILKSALTTFSDRGIKQRTIFGVREIQWGDVSRIRSNSRGGLRVSSKSDTIFVMAFVYSNHQLLTDWLKEKALRLGIKWDEYGS